MHYAPTFSVSAARVGRVVGVLFLLAAWLAVDVAVAQQSSIGDARTDGTSFYTFAEPGENTIRVMILGDVGRTGLYEVGEGTDLAELLALSGDRGFGIQRARHERTMTVRLHRSNDGNRQVAYEATLDDLIGASDVYPALRGGDVVQIEAVERQQFGWRDALSIVTAVASLALAAERLSRL